MVTEQTDQRFVEPNCMELEARATRYILDSCATPFQVHANLGPRMPEIKTRSGTREWLNDVRSVNFRASLSSFAFFF